MHDRAQVAEPSRRRGLLVDGLLMALTAVVAIATIVPVFAGELQITGQVASLGVVTEGTVLRHCFRVRNLEPWPVRITGLKSSCGCTTAAPMGRKLPLVLAPWEEVAFDARVDTFGRPGDLSKTVTILSSNDSPVAIIEISAKVTQR